MHPVDHTNAISKRGPITRINNGRGVRPWLPPVIVEPGWVYVVTKMPTMYKPQGIAVRCCWRCVYGMLERYEGHAAVEWEAEPPASGDRCARGERGFGERPDGNRVPE